MSTLFVVRHGQASFLADDYDHLSDVGRQQALLLGQYWAATGLKFDRLISGPRRRQIDTAQAVAAALTASGQSAPTVETTEAFDEYHAEAVLQAILPGLIETSDEVRRLHLEFSAATSRPAQLKTFQRMYEVVILGWARDEFDLPGIESWGAFCARVERGLADLAEATPAGSRVAVFTSGGPVGVSMRRALDLSHEHTLRLAWMVRNASYSEFLFSGTRFTLSAFNAHPHLVDAALLTYR